MSKSKFDYRKESTDIVYFTATKRNNSTMPEYINFAQNRSQDIVSKANDYYMAVISFDIPNSPMPIFEYEDVYSVTITEAGVDYQVFLIYDDYGDPARLLNPNFRGIYYFQQFLDMLNKALITAYNASGATGEIPKMFLRPDGRFEIKQDLAFSGELYFSAETYRLFLGIESYFVSYDGVNGKDEFLVNKDNGNNTITSGGVTYSLNVQENKSQYLWPDIRYIAITSSKIPSTKEYFGLDTFNTNAQTQIIADFVPLYTESGGIDRTDWTYSSGAGYRLVDLTSDSSIREIDFNAIGLTRTGKQIPIFLAPRAAATVKFMFIKKSLVNNEYNGLHHFSDSLKTDFAGIHQDNRITKKRYN